MKRALILLVLAAALVAPVRSAATADVIRASAGVQLGGGTTLVAKLLNPNMSLAQPVGWYCRADCNSCRRYCDYSYGDRRAFTLCMRDCWNRICRWC